MQRFLYVVLSEQCSDSSMGQAERANVEPPIAVVHLVDIVGLGNRMWWEITNVSSCLFHLTFGEEQLQSPVSMVDTCFDKSHTQILSNTICGRLSI